MPLDGLARYGDFSLLGLRLMTGAFLVHGVWDNILSSERMDEFAVFLARHGFPFAELAAPLSVGVQFVCGIGLLLGLATRAAGLVCCVNFVIALIMVHWTDDFRGWWPALTLVGIGAILATHGSGRFGLDRFFEPAGE